MAVFIPCPISRHKEHTVAGHTECRFYGKKRYNLSDKKRASFLPNGVLKNVKVVA